MFSQFSVETKKTSSFQISNVLKVRDPTVFLWGKGPTVPLYFPEHKIDPDHYSPGVIKSRSFAPIIQCATIISPSSQVLRDRLHQTRYHRRQQTQGGHTWSGR